MRHGSRTVGGVEIVALCDGVVNAGGPATESFPGATDDAWADVRTNHPDVFDGDVWRLHVHCFLLRAEDRTILVDTGVGPESAPAFSWTGRRGALLDELAAAGVDPLDVDTVVITHVHDDHLGWNVAEGAARPLFAEARYLVHRDDWEYMSTSDDEEDRTIFPAVLAPLEAAGALELTGDRTRLTPAIEVVHAPGHTPGHQVVLVDDGDDRAVVSGDLVNNPIQLRQPGVNGTTDMDPGLAAATRARYLERLIAEGRLAAAAHLPEAFGRFEAEGDHHRWSPAER